MFDEVEGGTVAALDGEQRVSGLTGLRVAGRPRDSRQDAGAIGLLDLRQE